MSDSPSYDSQINQLLDTRQFEQAYQLSAKAISDNPNHFMFYFYKGKAALELSEIKKDQKVQYLDEALQCLNQSVKEKPLKNEDAYFLLAQIHAARGNQQSIQMQVNQQQEPQYSQENNFRQQKFSLKLPPLVIQDDKSNQNTSYSLSQQQKQQTPPRQNTEQIRDSSCCILQ